MSPVNIDLRELDDLLQRLEFGVHAEDRMAAARELRSRVMRMRLELVQLREVVALFRAALPPEVKP